MELSPTSRNRETASVCHYLSDVCCRRFHDIAKQPPLLTPDSRWGMSACGHAPVRAQIEMHGGMSTCHKPRPEANVAAALLTDAAGSRSLYMAKG